METHRVTIPQERGKKGCNLKNVARFGEKSLSLDSYIAFNRGN